MLVLESNKEYSCAFEVVRTWNTILIIYMYIFMYINVLYI